MPISRDPIHSFSFSPPRHFQHGFGIELGLAAAYCPLGGDDIVKCAISTDSAINVFAGPALPGRDSRAAVAAATTRRHLFPIGDGNGCRGVSLVGALAIPVD